ncbi:ABC transporter ATP-binding protein [Thermogemmatispora aurantia]|nr:ABC transporter ATP-binding protein [Thermogemmatispora aurantia]
MLEHLSFSLAPGEFLCVLGQSGCGKTTLLRAIAGFLPLARGQLRLNGRDLTRLPAYRRNIGFVHQQYALFPHLTVAENVAFGLRERRLPARERQERVKHYLRLVHLESYAEFYPSELSGGMQQRVALARALAIEPDLLLLDEPLSALDFHLRIELRQQLLKIHQRFPRLPLVYVTHDCSEALQLADRLLLLRGGQIVQSAAPRLLYEYPRTLFAARYLGSVNVLPETICALAGLERRPGWCWIIRPERLHLLSAEEGPQRATSAAAEAESGRISLLGRLQAIEWNGAWQTLHVVLEGGGPDTQPSLLVSCPASREVPAQGEWLRLVFSPEDCRHVLMDE